MSRTAQVRENLLLIAPWWLLGSITTSQHHDDGVSGTLQAALDGLDRRAETKSSECAQGPLLFVSVIFLSASPTLPTRQPAHLMRAFNITHTCVKAGGSLLPRRACAAHSLAEVRDNPSRQLTSSQPLPLNPRTNSLPTAQRTLFPLPYLLSPKTFPPPLKKLEKIHTPTGAALPRPLKHLPAFRVGNDGQPRQP